MATTSVAICNMALRHAGVSTEIANLETESSEAANACRRFYEISREAALRDFDWPFATRFVAMALVATNPSDEWAYAYRYPTDCLKFRRIESGVRLDTFQTIVKYRVASDAEGLLILTDKEDAVGEYTVKVENETLYHPDFTIALSYRLALEIVPSITAGDPFNLLQKIAALYQGSLVIAQANAGNEEQEEEERTSEFERARL